MDRASGSRLYNPLLIWYAGLHTNLSSYGMSMLPRMLDLY